MDTEDDSTRTAEPQLPEDATDEQKAIYEAVMAFYRSDLPSEPLKQFVKPKAREFAHKIADDLGIYHRSDGRGRERHVVLAKTAPTIPSGRFDTATNSWKPYSYTTGDELLIEASLGPLDELRCLTFNVLHNPPFGYEDEELAASKDPEGVLAADNASKGDSATRIDPTWPALRTPACFKFLASRRAHIIALNEVSPEFFSELLEEPWAQSYWISELDISKYSIGNCLLSAYPIRTSIVHKFRMSEKVNNIVEIVLPGADRHPLWVSTAHLKAGPAHTNGRFRRSQSNEMARQLDYASSKGSTSIIIGDLNIRSTEGEVLQALVDWTDSWTTLRPDDVGYTYDPWNNNLAKMASERVCSFDSTRVKMANRYDRILTRGSALEAVSVEILATEPFGKFPDSEEPLHISDHFALETHFKFSQAT